jgi:hypothetical protein
MVLSIFTPLLLEPYHDVLGAISGAARPDSVPFFDDLCAK